LGCAWLADTPLPYPFQLDSFNINWARCTLWKAFALEVALSGLTITQGDGIAGNDYDGHGLGVLNLGVLTVTDCDLDYNSSGTPTFGSAVFNIGTLTVCGGHVSNNAGGGIANNGTLTVTNCTLNSNQGSAIDNAGTATISGCILRDNTAEAGAAIFNGGKLSVSGSDLSYNSAVWGGGAIFAAGTTTVSGCTLSGNYTGADSDGGAILVDDYLRSKVTISDCMFSKNFPDPVAGHFTNGGGNTFN
jgi:predicted outer membrane repeat protein